MLKVIGLFYPEDEGTAVLRKFGNALPNVSIMSETMIVDANRRWCNACCSGH